MTRYTLSKKADEDIMTLFIYGIDQFGPDQAERYVNGLVDQIEKVAGNPKLWPEIELPGRIYRRAIYQSHSIYYRITQSGIHIVRVLGQQDIYSHLL